MRKNFVISLLLILGIFIFQQSVGQSYLNVPVTGFNADVVANGSGIGSTSTNNDLDGAGSIFYASDFRPNGSAVCNPYELPDDRFITNFGTGLIYRLQPYNANNTLRVAASASGTLTFSPAVTASYLYFLCFNVGGGLENYFTARVNFTDGTNQTTTGLFAPNWCFGTSANPYLVNNSSYRKTTRSATTCNTATCPPRFFEMKVSISPANYSKTIASVAFTNQSQSLLHILAIGRKIAPAACAGTLSPRIARASVSVACPQTAINLTLTGTQEAIPGISYQWQRRAVGATSFTAITGANGPAYTVTNQTEASEYRVIETCANGGSSTGSWPVTVNQTPANDCYCIPGGVTAEFDYMPNVNFAGINHSPGFSSAAYKDFTETAGTANVVRGQSYPLSVNVSSQSSQIGAWIDFNHDGIFSNNEFTLLPASGTATLTANIAVPVTAAIGFTRMRIRSKSNFYHPANLTGNDACTNYTYGETIDYKVNIMAACSGTPVAGAAQSSTAAACAGTAFTLTVSGNYTGTTYQWQSRPAGTGNFTAIAGATGASYTVNNQTTATEYRRVITCTASGLSANSTSVTVTQSSFLNCYCVPSANNCNLEWIKNVQIGTLNNTSGCEGGYSNYTTYVPALQLTASSSYPISVAAHTNASNSRVGVWIDYNHNGQFDENEYTALNTGGGASTAFTFTGNINLPLAPLTGQTRMRVRLSREVAANQACSSPSQYGEYEDYRVNIVAAPACTGTPVLGAATTSSNNICINNSFTLSLATVPNMLPDYTYRWQRRPTGSGDFTFFGTTSNSPTLVITDQTEPTEYRCVVTCTGSGLTATSTTVAVGVQSYLNCYCTPAAICNTDYIRRVELRTLNHTLSCVSPVSGNYTSSQPTINMVRGSNNNLLIVNVRTNTATSELGVWIDFNHSGTFDPAEFTFIGIGGGSVNTDYMFSKNLVIPATALFGNARMRIALSRDGLPNNSACANTGGGTTGHKIDYMVNIIDGCVGTPTPGAAQASVSAACAGVPFNLSLNGAASPGTGITYQWESRPAGTGNYSNISGATSATYTVANQTVATDYRCYIRCTSPGGSSSTSAVVTVGMSPFINCYCVPTGNICTNEYIKSIQLGGLTNNSNCAAGYSDFTGTLSSIALARNYSYPISVFARTNQPNSQAGVWIDYNQNGGFEEDEFKLIGTGGGAATDFTFTNSIQIPLTALLGNTRMRVRLTNSGGVDASQPCTITTTSRFGEVEDYLVNIVTAPLTISLGNISAINMGTSNKISWETLAEDPGDIFEIQRSGNGSNFISIGTKAANGQATPAYYFIDDQPLAGMNYYRLLLINTDGTRKYSKVVTATVNANNFNLLVYPNPVKDNLNLVLKGGSGQGAVSITDISGRLLLLQRVPQNGSISIDVKSLLPAVYLVKYSDAANSKTIKITKK